MISLRQFSKKALAIIVSLSLSLSLIQLVLTNVGGIDVRADHTPVHTGASAVNDAADSTSEFVNERVSTETANAGTFRNCNFRGAQDNPNAFQDCLGTIFQFVIVISFLLILFRIALAALNSYNPLGGGNPVNNAVTIVWDIVLGLIFIGGPILILGTLNPALLNFQLIDITSITGSNNNGSSGNNGDGGNGTSTSQGSSTDGGRLFQGKNQQQTQDSYDYLFTGKNNKLDSSGSEVPVTAEDRADAADFFNRVKSSIYECHRILRPVSTNCAEWDQLTKERKELLLQGKRDLESDPNLNQDANTDGYNTQYIQQQGPYELTVGSIALEMYGSAPTTRFANIAGTDENCDEYMLQFQNPVLSSEETFSGGSNYVDANAFQSQQTFVSEICPGDTSNPYYTFDGEYTKGGTVEFKGIQTYDKGEVISDLLRI